MEAEDTFTAKYLLRSMILYLNDLRWIQRKLDLTQSITNFRYNYVEPIILGDSRNLGDWSINYGISKLDYLVIENVYCTIEFRKGKTLINYNSEDLTSSRIAKSIFLHLRTKQNIFPFISQSIFLYDNEIQKPLLFRDKTPVWVNLIFWLIPTILSIIALYLSTK